MTTVAAPYDAEVEYLESTGTQWIDTGLAGRDGYTLDVDFMYTAWASTYNYIAGCALNSNNRVYFTRKGPSDDAVGFRLTYNNNVNGSWSGGSLNTRYKVRSVAEAGNQKLVVDGTTRYTSSISTGVNTGNNIYLFCSSYGPAGKTGECAAKIYSAKFTYGGEVVRDFQPVRFTNELGQSEGAMYDKVSGQLFRNAGTGSFKYGPDVRLYSTPVMGLHFTRPYVAAHTARDYVQDGLIALFDVKENKDWGVHDATATTWVDLTGHEAPLTSSQGKYTWYDTYVTHVSAARNSSVARDFSGGITAEWVCSRDIEYMASTGSNTFIEYGFSGGSGQYVSVMLFYKSKGYTTYNNAYALFKQAHSVTCTVDAAGNSLLYKDGGELTLSGNTSPFTVFTGSYRVSLGRVLNGFTNYASCYRLYNRALTAEEIRHNRAIDVERFNLP